MRHNFQVCYYCTKAIHGEGIAWREGRTRFLSGGFEHDIHHAHKSCFRKHLPQNSFTDLIFRKVARGIRVKADFLKRKLAF